MGLTRDNMLFGDNNLQEGRLAYLDAAKGIAMLCIVTGHISYLYTPIDIWMSSFKITLFYFISGYLFSIRNSSYEKRCSIKNKSWRLFKEYLIWSVVAIFVDSVFMMLKNDFIWKRVFDNIIHLFMLRGVSTLWFLPGFMIAQSALVFLGSKKKNTVSLLVWVLLIVIVILYSNIIEVRCITNNIIVQDVIHVVIKSLVAFVFMLVGVLYARIGNKQSEYGNKTKFVAIIIILSLGIYTSQINTGVDLNNLEFGIKGVLFFVSGILNITSAIKYSNF